MSLEHRYESFRGYDTCRVCGRRSYEHPQQAGDTAQPAGHQCLRRFDDGLSDSEDVFCRRPYGHTGICRMTDV